MPSLVRIERTKTITLANLVVQLGSKQSKHCGIYDTGFAGVFYSPDVFSLVHDVDVVEQGRNITTPPLHWPTLYHRVSVAVR